MADETLLPLIAQVLKKLRTSAMDRSAYRWGARYDIKMLRKSLSMIEKQVRDAEQRQEYANSEAVEECLRRLRQVLNRANDLFDKGRMLCKVGILFSNLCYKRKFANEIKSIRKQLDAIHSGLALNILPAQELSIMKYGRTIITLNSEDVIIGRDNDAKLIIQMLFDSKYDGQNITIIPIVGSGGLGKTTLAQLVFNDQRVQNHFDLTARASVYPEKDDFSVIVPDIFRALAHDGTLYPPLDYIYEHGLYPIENKKYLLVLDDFWVEDRDKIATLLHLLKAGNKGSKVIVTTRSDIVARRIGSIETPYKLGTLTDGESWELFTRAAFGPGQDNNESRLSTIGKDIVKMCRNVPLAIRFVGCFLRYKHTERDWLLVKDDLSKGKLAQIMAVLKFYDHRTPALKWCFAYCTLFPKGYEFKRDDLVHLWVAQGYVQPHNADEYFLSLVAENIVQGNNDFDYVDVGIYKMNDLLHDLAQHVSENENMILGYEHVNLDGSTFPPSLKDVSRLQSLLNLHYTVNDENLLPNFQSLRALSMKIFEKKLPDSIGSLITLRYLKIEGNAIECLPGSITSLVNLQTLNLKLCFLLKELPEDFCKLHNLSHLLLPYDNLTDLPPGLDKLTSLQELNRFIVGEGNGINSLRASDCRGELDIEFCRWRRDAIEEVKEANLKNYHRLTSLTVHLKFEGDKSTPAADGMDEMLSCLQLPPNLKKLTFWNHKRDGKPASARCLSIGGSNLCNLCILRIVGCSELKNLRFESRNSIRQLCIQDCSSLNISEGLQHLSVLEKLYIKGCPDLAKRLVPNGEDFHLIQQTPNVYIRDGSKTYIRGRQD